MAGTKRKGNRIKKKASDLSLVRCLLAPQVVSCEHLGWVMLSKVILRKSKQHANGSNAQQIVRKCLTECDLD